MLKLTKNRIDLLDKTNYLVVDCVSEDINCNVVAKLTFGTFRFFYLKDRFHKIFAVEENSVENVEE